MFRQLPCRVLWLLRTVKIAKYPQQQFNAFFFFRFSFFLDSYASPSYSNPISNLLFPNSRARQSSINPLKRSKSPSPLLFFPPQSNASCVNVARLRRFAARLPSALFPQFFHVGCGAIVPRQQRCSDSRGAEDGNDAVTTTVPAEAEDPPVRRSTIQYGIKVLPRLSACGVHDPYIGGELWQVGSSS